MNILPKNVTGFSNKAYWNSFFKSKRGKETFEWYGEYDELSNLLHKYIKPKDHVLIVGCGNSSLSADLHRNGIQDQISVDISEVVIDRMKKQYPGISFAKEDVTSLTYESSEFSVVLDKGTFDALTQVSSAKKSKIKQGEVDNLEEEEDFEEDDKVNDKSNGMLEEIDRVMKLMGRFICISLLQPFVAKKLFTFFLSRGWMTRVYRCHEAERRNKEESTSNSGGGGCFLPVYLVVFTKFKHIEGSPVRIEFADEKKAVRKLKTLDELLSAIAEEQTFACLLRSLGELGGICSSEGLTFTTTTPEGLPRYRLHVVDCPKHFRNPVERKFAVFIVPQGRETEYIFSCHEGRLLLAQQSGFSRLLVVHLERDQVYPSLEAIKNELYDGIKMFTPKAVLDKKDFRSPILSIGDDVGERKVIARGKSKFVGEYVVEDVTCGSSQSKTFFRRLIFLSNPSGIQSEAQLIPVSGKQKMTNGKSSKRRSAHDDKKPVLRQSTGLSCLHHGVMCISFGMLKYFFEKEGDLNTVILGLGGGLMAKFIGDFFPKINVTAVEIDGEIAKIAKEYFCLQETSDRFHVVIDDALNFIKSTDIKFSSILIDVSNECAPDGLQCPPPIFVDEEIIQCYKDKLTPEGILVINLCCRNVKLSQELIERIYQVFPFIYQYQCTEDINTVIFCFLKIPDGNPKSFSSLLEKSISFVTHPNSESNGAALVKLDEEPALEILLENFMLLKNGQEN